MLPGLNSSKCRSTLWPTPVTIFFSFHATQKLDLTLEKAYKTNQEYGKTSARSKKAKEAVNKERYDLFMECFQPGFQHVSENIDTSTKPWPGSALRPRTPPAMPRNRLAGVWTTVASYRENLCRPMTSLSGGKQSLASLALLFAIRSCNPFFVMDEVDAALDSSNVAKLTNFICYDLYGHHI